jgi:hypothetical protein
MYRSKTGRFGMKQTVKILILATMILSIGCSVKVPSTRQIDRDDFLGNSGDNSGSGSTPVVADENRSGDGDGTGLPIPDYLGDGGLYDDFDKDVTDDDDLMVDNPGCEDKSLFSIWHEDVPENFIGEADVLNFKDEQYGWEFNMGGNDYGTLKGNEAVGYFLLEVHDVYDIVLSTEYRKTCDTLRICYIAWYEDLGMGNFSRLPDDFSQLPARITAMEGIEKTSTNLSGLFGPVGKSYENCLYYK